MLATKSSLHFLGFSLLVTTNWFFDKFLVLFGSQTVLMVWSFPSEAYWLQPA